MISHHVYMFCLYSRKENYIRVVHHILCSSDCIISISLSSNSLILSSSSSHLLFRPSSELFISNIVVFNSRISIGSYIHIYNFYLFIDILYLIRHCHHTIFNSLNVVSTSSLNIFKTAALKKNKQNPKQAEERKLKRLEQKQMI